MKKVLAMTLFLIFLLAGCGNKPAVDNQSDSNMTKVKNAVIYFSDGEESLVSEQRQISYKTDEALAAQLVEEIAKGPTETGHIATIPPATKINSVKISNGIAVVNLSEAFLTGLNGGSEAENLRIFSIVDTLTELQNIKVVHFVIDGQKGKLLGQTELNGDYVRDDKVIKVGNN